MQPVKLIFAKHRSPNRRVGVRGEEFARQKLEGIIQQREGRRVRLIVEDNFTGYDNRFMRSDIRGNLQLRQEFAEETRRYAEMRERTLAAAKEGRSETMDGVYLAFGDTVARANQETPGSMLIHPSESDEEARCRTLEATYWRNQGYGRAYFQGRTSEAIELLVKSIRLMARAVQQRDALLLEQVQRIRRESPEDILVVSIGSNHVYFVARWSQETEVEVHTPPNEPFPYYDEALRARLERNTEERELRALLRNDLRFHYTFLQELHNAYPGEYVEDIMQRVRRRMEER